MSSRLDHARAVLAANDVAADGSFMCAIHDEEVFDTDAFWRLFEAMKTIADAAPEARGEDTRQMATLLHQQFLLHIIYHLHALDSVRILRFPAEDLYAWMNRLAWVFEPVVRDQGLWRADVRRRSDAAVRTAALAEAARD
jgi:hypothetical protein